jgi:hypothetical protein
MQNMNEIAVDQGTALRELSLDEADMVGGGFSWGGLVHKAEAIGRTAIHNATNRNWNQITSDGENGLFWGSLAGGGIGLVYDGGEGAQAGAAVGGVIGGLVGVDIALARQDGFIG